MKAVDCFMEENNRKCSSLCGRGEDDKPCRQRITAADPDEFDEVYGSEEKDEDLRVTRIGGAKPGWRKMEFGKSMKGRG